MRLGKSEISDIKLTHDDGSTLLEFKAEAECNRAIHDFVRDYAFTTVWAEFEPVQSVLPIVMAPAPVIADKNKSVLN